MEVDGGSGGEVGATKSPRHDGKGAQRDGARRLGGRIRSFNLKLSTSKREIVFRSEASVGIELGGPTGV